MIDLLFLAWNRLEFTRQSFEALIANTNWDLVDRLFVLDDGSSDGTREYLYDAVGKVPVETEEHNLRVGGPVAAMNWYLDHGRAETFAKIDNDTVVCPYWLDEMARLLEMNPTVDILGMEPMRPEDGPWFPPCGTRYAREARFIGGKGLVRRRAFRDSRMIANGYFGFTSWQERHPAVRKAWATPDLPTFGLDQLPIARWRELTDHYVEIGWQRRWDEYAPAAHAYWDWWTPVT